MAQSRLTKDELRHDAVQDTLLEGVDFLQRHLKWVIVAGVAAAVIVAAWIGIYAYRQYTAQKESAAFYAAEKVLAQPGAQKVEERVKQAEVALQKFVEDNASSSLAPAAYGYLARFAFDRKEYDKAEAAYQKALAHSKIDATQRAATLLALGKLREAQGKPAEALAFYNQIDDKRFEDAKAYALGTAELAAGKAEDARKKFQSAATGQPGTSISTWAKDALDYLP